jgi:uncharacterized phiE125 gp8 family phage protein
MTVPLSTIKSALKIDYADDDADLVRLREAAISLVERRTQLLLSPQTQTLYLASWTDTLVPAFPFSAISAITYKDSSNASATMTATDYWIDLTQGPIPVLRFMQSPGIYQGTAITVTYTAGYSAVPNEITHVIIALVGAWYNNPEAFQPIGLTAVPLSVEYILANVSTRSHIR